MNSSRRRNSSDVTREIEDAGLFISPPTALAIQLLPRIRKNSRGDVVIKGRLGQTASIDVIFAGRRKIHSEHLVSTLRALWDAANRGTQAKLHPTKVDTVQLPVRILGSWRSRFVVNDQGWQTREFQLLAAYWTYTSTQGFTETFGEPPICTP